MIFELTQDYQILVPLMVANMLSFLISRHFQPTPVYHALLEQNHIYLPGPEAQLGSSSWKVGNVMTRQIDFISENALVEEASKWARNKDSASFLVGTRDHLVGITTRDAIEHAVRSGRGSQSVGLLTTIDFEYLYADQPLELALERFDASAGFVPVLSRSGNRRLEGVITIEKILEFIQRKPA